MELRALGPAATLSATPQENWLRAEREFAVVHEYDTVDRDLERLGLTLTRVPVEVGAVWRLELPRGELVEAWEPGNQGLTPPAEITRLTSGVVDRKKLVPAPPSTHGDVQRNVVEGVARADASLDDPHDFAKGSTWILEVHRGEITTVGDAIEAC